MRFSKEDLEVLIGAIEEIKVHLEGLEDKIITMEQVASKDSIKDVYRAFHSIKGLAGFANLDQIVKVTHKLEEKIKAVMDGNGDVNSKLIDLLLHGTDYVRNFISELEKHLPTQGEEVEIPTLDEFEEELFTLLSADEEAPGRVQTGERIRSIPEQEYKAGSEDRNLYNSDKQSIFEEAPEFLVEYFQETSEYLSSIEENTLEYENSKSKDHLKEIIRAFHSIKGGTRLILSFPEYGNNQILRSIERIAHNVEDEFELSLNSERDIDTEKVLKSVDVIRTLLQNFTSAKTINEEEIEKFERALGLKKGTLSDVSTKPKDGECNEEMNTSPLFSTDVLRNVAEQMIDFISAMEMDQSLSVKDFERILVPVGEGLKRLGDQMGLELIGQLQAEVEKGNFHEAKKKVRNLLDRLENFKVQEQNTVKISETNRNLDERTREIQRMNQPHTPVFVRVEREKIEFLGNLAGEFITFKNELKYFVKRLEYVDRRLFVEMKNLLSRFDKLIFDLQNGTMALRMTPVSELFLRFKRTVRDLAKSLNKKVTLVTEGEDVQIDRNIIEMLVDPLTHMIRNSIDHGIEPPEERLRKGKSEEGTVTLRAYYSGNYAVIEVEDDGRGIDVEKIRYKAIERGLKTPEEAFQIPDEEVVLLIFEPGFSTKDSASEISGRGVGMDVVKAVAKRIGGDVFVEYKKDEWTRIGLKIPLSLMILRGLLFEIRGEKYIVPIDSVRETVKVAKEQVIKHKDVYLANIRGEILPVIFVESMLTEKWVDFNSKEYPFGKIPLIVIETAEVLFALAVDRFVEEGEYLIKSIPEEFRFTGLFTGATIMGDGSIVLIMNPEMLIKKMA